MEEKNEYIMTGNNLNQDNSPLYIIINTEKEMQEQHKLKK